MFLPLGGDKSAWEVQNLITAFTSRIYGRFVEDWTLTWPLTLPRFGIGDRHHEQVIGSPADARLGVPEVWRYDQKQLQLYQLVNGMYIETETSLAFAEFPVKSIPDFIKQNLATGRNALRSFRCG